MWILVSSRCRGFVAFDFHGHTHLRFTASSGWKYASVYKGFNIAPVAVFSNIETEHQNSFVAKL